MALIEACFQCFVGIRFKCKVNINGVDYDAYISSSSGLKKYININKGSQCLVYLGKKGYILFAVEVDKDFIIVDLKKLNKMFGDFLNQKELKYEKRFGKYRTDLLDIENKVVYELKGVLGNSSNISYPDNNSRRIYSQLDAMKELLGYECYMIFLILCRKIKQITFSDDFVCRYLNLSNLNIEFYYCVLEDNQIKFIKTAINTNLEGKHVRKQISSTT